MAMMIHEALPSLGSHHRKAMATNILLLVEDNAAVRQVLAMQVNRLGWDVIEAGTGMGALGQASRLRGRPFVALIDVKLPDVSGLRVVQELTRTMPECQVILMSGAPIPAPGIASGLLGVLEKPFAGAELEQLLERAGEGHSTVGT